jgi:hypothetical protein
MSRAQWRECTMGSRGGTRPGGVPVLFSTAAAGVSRHERSRPCSSSAVPHLQSVIHPRVSSTPKATVGEDRSVGGDSKRTTASTGRTGGGWSSVRRGWRGRSGLHCSREEKDVGGGGRSVPLPTTMSVAAKLRGVAQVEKLRPLLYCVGKRTTLCNLAQISRADDVEMFCDAQRKFRD